MSTTYNVYCDESCHLENDRQKAMVLGALWCPMEKVREIADNIRGIKEYEEYLKQQTCIGDIFRKILANLPQRFANHRPVVVSP